MNYKRIYQKIIKNRKNNSFDGYTETHHIIPRSLGGTNDKENLVNLSAREHFICHALLANMYTKESNEWYKMNYALSMMQSQSHSMNNSRYFNSHLYSYYRDRFKNYIGKVNSIHQSGSGNSQYGTMWISNIELKETKRIHRNEKIPNGWIKGRSIWNNLAICPNCNNEFLKPTNKTTYCSNNCKKEFEKPDHFKFIDDNFEEMANTFDELKSIQKTLVKYSFDYSSRVGNKYFSNKLKESGRSILRRRNTGEA